MSTSNPSRVGRRLRKRLEGSLGYLVLRILSAAVACLPERWSYRLADLLGGLIYRLSRRYRRVGLRNLTIAFGSTLSSAEIRDLSRRNFRHFAHVLVDFLRSPHISPADLRRRVTFREPQYLAQAYAQGRGVILLTAHLGNWEWLGVRVAQDCPLSAVARRGDDPATDQMVNFIRRHGGAEPIYTDDVRRTLSALREGGILGILLDQNTAVGGVFVDFFGKPAATAVGPVVLAQRTGAPIVPVFAIRVGLGRYEMHSRPPVELVSTGDKQADLQENVARCVRVIEETIRSYPEQWLWFHDRWRTRPPEEQSSPNPPSCPPS